MYMCTYVCMYIYMYMYMYMYTYMYMCIYINMYTYKGVYIYVCIWVYRFETLLPNAPRSVHRSRCASSLYSRHPTWSMTTWGCLQCLKQAMMEDLELLTWHNHLRRVRCGSGCMPC